MHLAKVNVQVKTDWSARSKLKLIGKVSGIAHEVGFRSHSRKYFDLNNQMLLSALDLTATIIRRLPTGEAETFSAEIFNGILFTFRLSALHWLEPCLIDVCVAPNAFADRSLFVYWICTRSSKKLEFGWFSV